MIIDIDDFKYQKAEREAHLDMALGELIYKVICMQEDDIIAPSIIAALIWVAQKVANEHAEEIGENYFEACIKDVLNGGTGLHVGTTYSASK